MPDLCFYAPWIMKEPIPDPFRMMLEKAGKKRISYDEADCSMRNIRKQGKVSRLHGPTLHALLTLIQIRKEKDSGAAGIQRGRDAINYFCMEYPGNQGKYVMTYNSKNGRFSGILKTEEKNEKLPGIREGKNTGEQYLALLAYANLVPDNPLFNEEFQKNFYILEEQEKKEWEDMESALRAAFICCDAMYCEVIANPQQAVPLEKSQFRAEELEDVLPEYKIAAGVYAPNDEIYGKFHVLLPVNEKTKRTLFELKQIYSGRWDVNERTKERTKERIPSLPEDYLVSKEAEEILQMVDKTPARLFMMTGDAGTGKTTDARMIAQILGLPYYVFTCGPGTDELELLATTVPNMGGTAHLEMEFTNHILLIIWKYFAEIIDEIEKNSTENEEQKPEQEEREGQKENPNESEEEPEEEKQGNTGSQTEQNEDKIRKEDTEQESETENKAERNGKDQETEDHENGRTAELQKFLQQLCENLPKCVRESGGFEDKQNECGIPASETEASSDNALQKILYEMAKETLDEKIQKEIFEHLQKELMEIPFEEGHDLVQKKLCRKTEISDFLKLLTEKYEGQLKQVKKRLRLKLLPILKNQKERTEHKLFLGRRVDLRNIAAPSRAVFKKQQPGKKLDICVAVLVDNSFSMCGERMDHAILAALCLYDFCMESEIPVLVCGHHTDGYRHENLKDETVYLHCCADFETDEKDRFRIAGMQPYGSNRDGTALWYAGSRLLERPEKQKLLFVISDGAPNANQYGGIGAKRDLQKIRKKLLQQGVFFQAAAIGSDKEAIQEIYEESFLDITDLEQLPALLTKKLLRFIRR